MQNSVEDLAFAISDAFVAPSLGTAELVVAFLVAAFFIGSAVQTIAKGRDEGHWGNPRT